MTWLELPWINKTEICRMIGIDDSNISKKLKGKQAFTPEQLAQLNALQRSLPIQIQRAKAVKNPLKNHVPDQTTL